MAGRRIGSVAGLSVAELEALVREDEQAAAEVPRAHRDGRTLTASSHVDKCLAALQEPEIDVADGSNVVEFPFDVDIAQFDPGFAGGDRTEIGLPAPGIGKQRPGR